MRHVHKSLNMVILTYKADIMVHVTKQNQKKKKIRKNTIESSNGSRLKFIAPDQINMSSPFAYIKCQAKQFYTQWTDMFFVFCFFFCLLATIICYMYYFTA